MAKLPDAANILDSVIKAPLWLFFAGMIGFGVPLIDLPRLHELGISPALKIGPYPVAVPCLICAALFVSSAAARSLNVVRDIFENRRGPTIWLHRVRGLSHPARAVLAHVEEQALNEFYLPPTFEPVGELRDAGFIEPLVVADDRRWGHYMYAWEYGQTLGRHKHRFRKVIRSQQDEIGRVRRAMNMAVEAANRRV